MKKEKEIITQKPGAFLLWITGLAGAGKTTVGKKVKAILDNLDVKVVHLDGDVFRKINNNRFGYTKEDRLKNALALAKLSHLLLNQCVNVICTTVSLFD